MFAWLQRAGIARDAKVAREGLQSSSEGVCLLLGLYAQTAVCTRDKGLRPCPFHNSCPLTPGPDDVVAKVA